jgi:hypothetical protein
VSADANDPPTRPELKRKRVKVGSYVLVVGDPAGMEIKAIAGQAAAGQAKSGPLEQAIAQADREPEPPRTGADRLEDAVDDAAEVTSKIELALSLFTQIVQGIDPVDIGGDLEALLDLLERLDREERWKEALQVARALVKLLVLLERWLQLLQSLRTALRAAKRFEDRAAQAWALHEQGTLYLVAEKHADADTLLSEAHDLRYGLDDTHGLTITDHNLQVLCETLRARLHPTSPRGWLKRIVERPVAALILAMSLLLLGGVAGAVIGSSGGTRTITVTTTNPKPSPPGVKESSISLACPAGPVQLGERVRISGKLKPAQVGETITIAYTTPSGATHSETQKTQADGAYQAVASAEEPGEWHVAGSWLGNAKYKNALGTCAFHVGAPSKPEAVSIIANPESASVEPGHDASFTATARGFPTPTVQWEESSDAGRTFSAIPGATTTIFTVKAVETTDNGRQYRAVFTNSTDSRTSEVATLTVSTPGTVTSE